MPATKAPTKPVQTATPARRAVIVAPAPAPAAAPPAPTYRTQGATPSSAEIVLKVQGLVKRYGKVPALQGVDVEVRKGEVMAFLGPNGAGKTTFTKCVLGMIKPTEGRVELFGEEVHASNRTAFDRVGIVPDQYDLYGTLNARQHLRFYGRLHGLSGQALRDRIEETLRVVGMQDLANRRTREYSHGMKQRICIAQALLHRPDFVIFDEPTNGLDPRGSYEIRELIRGLGKQGVTIFLSSHILAEVEEVCTRVAILSKGKILIQSTVADLRKRLKGDRTKVTIKLERTSVEYQTALTGSKLVQSASLIEGGLEIEVANANVVPDVIALLARKGARIVGVEEETMGLEEMFLQLTAGEGGR